MLSPFAITWTRVPTVAMFVADRMSASSRLRALQYIDLLTEDGIRVRVCATRPSKYLPRPTWLPPGGPLRFLYLVLGMVAIIVQRVCQICAIVPRVTVVLLQKDLLFRSRVSLLERLLIAVARLCRVRVVFDVDDPIYLGTSLDALPHMRPKIAAIARGATAVLAGSDSIARQLRPYSKELWLAPTCIKLGERPVRTYETRGGALRLTWSGTASNARHLALICDSLRQLWSTVPLQIEIVTRLADIPMDLLREFDPQLTEWSNYNEAVALHRADVALAPLEDNVWTQAKCGGRILSYFSAAIPVIASPVGAQGAMVRHDLTGLVATTTEDWTASLTAMLRSRTLRTRLGQAGRTFVEDNLAAHERYPEWRERVMGQ